MEISPFCDARGDALGLVDVERLVQLPKARRDACGGLSERLGQLLRNMLDSPHFQPGPTTLESSGQTTAPLVPFPSMDFSKYGKKPSKQRQWAIPLTTEGQALMIEAKKQLEAAVHNVDESRLKDMLKDAGLSEA